MGDLDGMADRGVIRALVVYSKTFYFYDKGHPRGISCEALQAFEEHVNKALKLGSVRVNVVFIPVHRDELIEALVKGKGDIAVSNLTITPDRQRLVDFSDPVLTGVKEIVVTSTNPPQLTTLDDLSGK
ncbi:MAG: transporter substrate-binding domain-containing protein, partial [Proteobacteria bacterium]|nr:transporter substrate-binding domain-containing protein [Pseudomonadota bacterium]